jgi:2'-5' RNA ligase superfamily
VTADKFRYGVFLRPDAGTSAAVVHITSVVRSQYGFVSAHRFPPHVTLAGSLPLAVGENELLDAVRVVAAGHRAFPVHNRGVARLGDAAVVFDVHEDDAGVPNRPLVDLAADVGGVVAPLLRDVAGLPADVRSRTDWRGHLSLASHELFERADLRDEVETFVRDLRTPHPRSFEATCLTVYRLRHPDWAGPWWTTFLWEHVRSIPLAD